VRRQLDACQRHEAGRQLQRIKELESPMLLPGIKLNTSATDFYPIQAGQLARFDGSNWKLFGDMISNES
jgi:branched-chain amino acid transport system substrate-binding protein